MYPLTPSKWFSDFIERKGLKKIAFHQLRHTSATMLINAGLNIRALSARLGHSNTSTTLNIYSHALKSTDKIAAEKMEQKRMQNRCTLLFFLNCVPTLYYVNHARKNKNLVTVMITRFGLAHPEGLEPPTN